MCHTEMEGKIKPACQRHWAKETSSVPDIPILLEPGADDRLQLMGREIIKHCHIHPLMGFLPFKRYTLTFDDVKRKDKQD